MASTSSDYEKRRMQNIEDNKRVLSELGLLNPYLKLCITRRTNLEKPDKGRTTKLKLSYKKSQLAVSYDGKRNDIEDQPLKRRKSARLRGVGPSEELLGSEDEENTQPVKKAYIHREKTYGHIDGVETGTCWETRMECSQDGIHRPTVAGIHGNSETGAYSIALSGGYEDNIDLGDCFTYTGEGGRDLKGTKANPKNLRTAPQSKDQTLTRGNLALSQSVKTQNPVRVIRGYKLPTVFAPETGYRYDGLYTVTKCWYATGASGFGVWKFALKRCPGQAPLPFEVTQLSDE